MVGLIREQNAGGRLAGRMVRGRGQHPPQGHPARPRTGARRGAGRGLDRGRAMLAGIKAAANLRGRGGAGFATGHQMGGLPQRAGSGQPGTLRRLQCRRGRARHLQGPRAAEQLRRPGVRGHDHRRLVVGASQGLLYLRGEYRYLLEPLESALAHGAGPACWAKTSSARASTSTSRSTSAPAPMSAARNPP
jgi:hypothetical protein